MLEQIHWYKDCSNQFPTGLYFCFWNILNHEQYKLFLWNFQTIFTALLSSSSGKTISTGLLERESTISNNTERNIIENKMLNGNGQTQLSRVY